MPPHRMPQLVISERQGRGRRPLVPPATLQRRRQDRLLIFGDSEAEVGTAAWIMRGRGRRRQLQLIGAARALFFPRITLTGLLGVASGSLGDLFSGSAQTWSFTGDVVGPIYTGGGLTAAVDQAEARRDQSFANYEIVIQNAFRDVEDSLADVRHSAELRETLTRRVATLRRGVQLANIRYDNGYSDYLEVLDTERSLFSAELQLASARGDYQRALVSLYRALGGDWMTPTPSAGSSPPSGGSNQ